MPPCRATTTSGGKRHSSRIIDVAVTPLTPVATRVILSVSEFVRGQLEPVVADAFDFTLMSRRDWERLRGYPERAEPQAQQRLGRDRRARWNRTVVMRLTSAGSSMPT